MRRRRKARLAVWKFASCDGCQLSLLDCEDELLAVAEAMDIAYFVEASSTRMRGPYDLSLVEGSITTTRDLERIQEVRRQSRTLVAIGACATAGGIQALRNFGDADRLRAAVYPRPQEIAALAESTPIAAHVTVDLELRGCPVAKSQVLEVVTAFLAGRRPQLSAEYGIEGTCFDVGAPPSPAIADAAIRVADQIRQQLRQPPPLAGKESRAEVQQ